MNVIFIKNDKQGIQLGEGVARLFGLRVESVNFTFDSGVVATWLCAKNIRISLFFLDGYPKV